jgi:hypothetical protein
MWYSEVRLGVAGKACQCGGNYKIDWGGYWKEEGQMKETQHHWKTLETHFLILFEQF